MHLTATPLSRRATLGVIGVASTVSLSGCGLSLRPPDDDDDDDASGDRALVDTVVEKLRELEANARPAYRDLHRAHLDALGSSVATDAESEAPEAPSLGPAQVRKREQALPRELTNASVSAEDAELVRLLASMAAAQRQLLLARPLGAS